VTRRPGPRPRRLSRIYITHGHGDHWLGLARLAQRFPGATGLATAKVLARVELEAGPAMAGYWESILPGEVPTGAEKVLPQLLTADTIDLEGNELRVIKIGQADTAESTIVHIPSLGAVVTGDLAYNEVHMMTAETGEAERAYAGSPTWTKLPPSSPSSSSPAIRRSRTITTRRSLGSPSSTYATSPGLSPRRPRQPASWPGWSSATPTGATSTRSGIPPKQPPSASPASSSKRLVCDGLGVVTTS
jgi:hypothetical protein